MYKAMPIEKLPTVRKAHELLELVDATDDLSLNDLLNIFHATTVSSAEFGFYEELLMLLEQAHITPSERLVLFGNIAQLVREVITDALDTSVEEFVNNDDGEII